MVRVLLTGASGFVGSHVLAKLLTDTDWDVACPIRDSPGRITDVLRGVTAGAARRVTVIHFGDPDIMGPVDVIMNVASDARTDHSIDRPTESVLGNVEHVLGVLGLARAVDPRVFLHLSTNEVYGPTYGDRAHREWDSIRPANPYGAGKACQEAIAHAYWRTYDVPVVITNTMNLIGPGQDPTKFVPVCVDRILSGARVDIIAAEDGTVSARSWLHARDLADAWILLARRYLADPPPLYSAGDCGPARFHITGAQEVDNLSLYHLIRDTVRREATHLWALPPANVSLVRSTRPGHEARYALDGSRMTHLGWSPPTPLVDALHEIVSDILARREMLA